MFSSPREQMHPFGMPRPTPGESRWKPSVEIAPNCPRCDSSNTKFCYYNNYSLTQPRYFCKGCRRYWTKGGSLRNVPVGGGCRKNRRGKSVRVSSRSSGSNSDDHGRQIAPSALRPDLALDDMVGSSHQSMLPLPESPRIDLAVLYSKFLNPGPDPADVGPGEMGTIGELSYPFDETSGYDASVGMPTADDTWQESELLCPFPGMECDWSSLDQSSFGAF